MLLYGKPEELIKAITEELELLASITNIDTKLDEFIRNKSVLLKKCIEELSKYKPGEYQVIAIKSCTIIPLQ